MKFSPIPPDSRPALLREDGDAVALAEVTETLVVALKYHGHFGNLLHNVSKGDWEAVTQAVQQILERPSDADELSPLARNLATMLSGPVSPNILPLHAWFLDLLEANTTTLFRWSVGRRLDDLSAQIRADGPRFRKSAQRILAEADDRRR